MKLSRVLLVMLCACGLVAAPVAAGALASAGTGGEAAPASVRALPDPAPALAALLQPPPVAAWIRLARAAAREEALRAARAERAAVLVDKRRGLPPTYRPRRLVAPRVPFLAGVGGEQRLMRPRAARALERLFAVARRDGVALAGVSGFRSYATQRALFRSYARERGVRRAARTSARAGHSEHQTGLVIDVAGADGRCAASACFAGSRAARWLARHAHEHGFVVRYPAGKERVTGYAHEPWHLRYAGRPLARLAATTGSTLDELLRP